MQSGQIRMGFPAVGSWVTYGLGSESASLPAFVVMNDHRGGPLGGPNDWSAGFMPATYQGTLFRAVGDPIVDLQPPAGMTAGQQRARLDALAKLNEIDLARNPGNSELAARIASYELAYRMQGCAPEAVDISGRVGGDEAALRPRQPAHRAVRPPVPAGAAPGGARRPLRAALPRRPGPAEHRHLGRAQQPEGEPRAARRGDGPAHRRPADGPEGARPARTRRCWCGTPSSAACRSPSAASDATTTRAP